MVMKAAIFWTLMMTLGDSRIISSTRLRVDSTVARKAHVAANPV